MSGLLYLSRRVWLLSIEHLSERWGERRGKVELDHIALRGQTKRVIYPDCIHYRRNAARCTMASSAVVIIKPLFQTCSRLSQCGKRTFVNVLDGHLIEHYFCS